jgi:hypothetical protein
VLVPNNVHDALKVATDVRERLTAEGALKGLVLRYTFHCERAEGRILVADLLLRIASDFAPRLDFVHVLELENDDAVRWRLASYRKCLIEPASDVFAPIVIDGLLRRWEKVFYFYLPLLSSMGGIWSGCVTS